MTTGQQLRSEGQAAVLAADTSVHRGYADEVARAVDNLASLGRDFTAEDVREVIEAYAPDVQPHHPNVLPAVLGSLAAAGRIRAVGHTRCTRSSRRHGWMRVWQVVPH